MNKRAIAALLLAILMPLIGYITVKYLSSDAIHMPRHYFEPDSIVVNNKKGKETSDTIWHAVKNLHMTNQYGKNVTLDSLQGKIVIIDLFFTKCQGICPGKARSMKKLRDSYAKSDSLVQFLSISIDPERDSVHHLRAFAERYDINNDNWWFVTGNKKEIYDFALGELKASVADTTVTPDFVHTDLFFLLDKKRVVRGFYHEANDNDMAKLAKDISLLILERDKAAPSFFRRFIPILPVIFVAIGIVILASAFFARRKRKEDLKG
jgi:protein SCO1